MDGPVVSFSVKPESQVSSPNTLKCPTEAIVGRKKQDDCHDSTIYVRRSLSSKLSRSRRLREDTNLGQQPTRGGEMRSAYDSTTFAATIRCHAVGPMVPGLTQDQRLLTGFLFQHPRD
jgi:hypothetical protein